MTKHLPTRLLALLTALSLSLLFTACGASSKGQSSETAMDAEAEEVIYENTAAEAPADKANSMLSDPLSPVSYTHLDVYKRQLCIRRSKPKV